MTVVYKFPNELSPDIMNHGLGVLKHRYNTRHYNLFVTDWPKTTYMVETQFHLKLIKYGNYCHVKYTVFGKT